MDNITQFSPEDNEEKEDPNLIMRQEIRRNPNYIRPYKVKEKPTWDPDYMPLPKPDNIPQAKVHYDKEKKYERGTEKS